MAAAASPACAPRPLQRRTPQPAWSGIAVLAPSKNARGANVFLSPVRHDAPIGRVRGHPASRDAHGARRTERVEGMVEGMVGGSEGPRGGCAAGTGRTGAQAGTAGPPLPWADRATGRPWIEPTLARAMPGSSRRWLGRCRTQAAPDPGGERLQAQAVVGAALRRSARVRATTAVALSRSPSGRRSSARWAFASSIVRGPAP